MEEEQEEYLHYQVYQSLIDNKPAFITFCEELAEYTPEEVPAYFCSLMIHTKTDHGQGLPSPDEFDALDVLEDAFIELLSGHEGIFAGRMTYDNKRVLYAYSDIDRETFERELERVAYEQKYKVGTLHEESNMLEAYFQDLYPTDSERALIHIDTILRVLREHGDTLSEPREISHWSYFPGEAIALDYVTWLTAQGYECDVPYPLEKDEDTWSVRFTHQCVPDRVNLFQRIQLLTENAKSLGGTYDGWETQVIAFSA
jgi:uncharacterized protein (TIGR01619 family)